MKNRTKVLAAIMAGCMIFGQTVFAEDAGSEDPSAGQNEQAVSQELDSQPEAQKEQEETPDTDSAVQQDEAAASEKMTEDDSHAEEINLTMYVGIPYHMEKICEERPWYFEADSSNSDVCQVSEPALTQPDGKCSACFNITPVKEGKTDISLWSVSYDNASYDEEIRVKEAVYHIEVKELPSDAVKFNDPVLVKELMDNGCDNNKDGYISQEELSKADYLTLSRTSWSSYEKGEFIADLTGLEYASNLRSISLNGNSDLQDISPLSGLKKLNYIELDETGVSDQTKWEFAVKDQIDCEKGDEVQIPSVGNLFGQDYSAVKIEVLDNPDDNVISEIQNSNYEYPYFYAFNPGIARIRISWGDFTKEVTVNVTGTEADQTMDVDYNVPIQFSTLNAENQSYTYALKNNGELWQISPEMKVIGKSVKKVDYSYVLKEDGKVYDIKDMNHVLIEDVKELSNGAVLKNDGTVWELSEDGSCTQIAEDVKQIAGGRFYLKNDGKLYHWQTGKLTAENVEYLVWDGYYVSGEGFHVAYPYDAVITGIKPVQMSWRYHREVNGQYMSYDLAVTENGDVWALVGGMYDAGYTGEMVKLGSNFAGNSLIGEQWDWYDIEGNYYKWDQVVTPSETSPVEVKIASVGMDNYTLMKQNDNSDNHCYKNGAEMLNGVKDITVMNYEKIYALRNDGSIWDVTGTPKKLGTLNTGDDIVKGDVTGDGKVEIADLRLMLRALCKKTTLDAVQSQAADVVQNGEVDIADMRMVLRYVCGKIDSL